MTAHTFVRDTHLLFERDPDALWWPGRSEVDRHTPGDIETIPAFFNEVGEALAHGFHAHSLSFEFCDGVANGLYGVLMAAQFADPQPAWPELFYDVYLAFDAGEYHRETDPPSVDPIEKYTVRMIGKIVMALSQSPYRPQF